MNAFQSFFLAAARGTWVSFDNASAAACFAAGHLANLAEPSVGENVDSMRLKKSLTMSFEEKAREDRWSWSPTAKGETERVLKSLLTKLLSARKRRLALKPF